MSDFRPFFRNLLVPAVSIALLSLGSAGAAPLFAGVTGIESRAGNDPATQVVEFQADLPFQYQMQVLDQDHIVLRLYNARLAQGLLTPEGGVNLLAGGAVRGATLKKSPAVNQKITEGEYQEVILNGPGLGTRKIQISGATQLPLVAGKAEKLPAQRLATTAKPQTSVGKTASPVSTVAKPSVKPNIALKPRANDRLFNIRNLRRDTQLTPEPNMRQPMAMLAFVGQQENRHAVPPRIEIAEAGLGKPQIESVTNAAALRPAVMSRPDVIPAPGYDAQASGQSPQAFSQANSVQEEATAQAAPEPGYQVVMPIPRYKGGAAPIQAMTLDSQGRPVLIHPKNTPIAEYAVASVNGGYNALFQAETPEPEGADSTTDQMSRLMSDALGDYQAGRYIQAQSVIRQALALDAQNADLYAALAEIQLKLNQAEQANQSYQKASGLDEGKYAQRYAQVLVLSDNRPAAMAFLEAQCRKNPKQAQIVYMLGTLHEEAGHTAQALTYLRQAAALHPASADIQYNLGLAFELSGDREQAEMHYRKALSLNPGATDIAKALERVRS